MPTDLVQRYRFDASDLPSAAVIFGSTRAMRDVHGQIERILHNDLPVLIRGESGTGKEVVAKFLHARSDRRDFPFVKVSCAVIRTSSPENDLSGAGEGNCNGAHGLQRGLLEAAAGGTLFLDEIGDMEWGLQSELLDLLEDGRSQSHGVGWGRPRARVICSTSRDLEAAVEQRRFRRDLFYRIEVINLRLAPLRERKDDIPQLCEHFLEKLAKRFDKSAPAIGQRAMRLLKQWTWPGNLRELENRIARWIVLGDASSAAVEPLANSDAAAGAIHPAPVRRHRLQPAAPLGRAALLRALRSNDWNRRKAAGALNISIRSLLTLMRKSGLVRRCRAHGILLPRPGPT
jgi:DNA-binding NtrC family response regulator